MPRLLLLCEYPTLNGGERSMLATLGAVREAGFCVAVAAPPAGALADALRAGGIEVVPFSTRDAADKRLPQERLREELAALLNSRRPDLLHANSLAMGRLAGPVAAKLRIPSIAHLRDIITLSAQAIADLNCNRRLLAVSEAVRNFHVAAGMDAGKTHVLYNGVDLAQFRPRPPIGYLHRELGLPPDAMLLAAIGQIGLRKGQDVFLNALLSLRVRSPADFPTPNGREAESSLNAFRGPHAEREEYIDRATPLHLLLVGQRHSEKEESRQFEADLYAVAEQLPGRVHFLGVRGDVASMLNELTLLVHPARQEPLGRVLLEAAASGVPVVATDVGGTREIFPPDSNCAILVPPDDPAALAEAISTLLADASLRNRLASAARRRAEAAFDSQSAASRLVQHYQAMIASS
jgi:glycosyltransferase involved in cell wall biosynthesis